VSEQTSPASPTRGPRPVTEIGTLPPIDVVDKRLPVDPATGRPRREVLATIATICYILAAGASAVALARAWWGTINMRTFHLATNLMTWTDPRPGSLASVLLAALMMVIGGVMVAMPALLAVNTWLGRRWVRWGAIGGVAAAALAVTLNPLAWIGAPFSIAGGVLVWLPSTRRWFELWRQVRSEPEVERFTPRPVTYGPVAKHM
jgi:hypothetical protein